MESLFLLIPLAVLFAVLSVLAFFWAVKHRQFDDLENAGRCMLYDADPPAANSDDEARRD